MPVKRVGKLDINQDLDFQGKEWTVQRAGWVIMALLLLAGVLGLLGRGPLARGQTGDPNAPLSAEYYTLDRYEAQSELQLHIGPNTASKEGQVRLAINQDYLDRIMIERIDPEPDSVEAAVDSQIFVFGVADPAQPIDVTFHLGFNDFGMARGEVGIEGGPQISFSQFVFP